MDVDDFGNLCMGCMRDKGDSVGCPQCGYQLDRDRSPFALPYQAVLNNKFLIGRILGKPGGFGMTYLALDLVLHTTVAIKEYLPRELVARNANSFKVVPHSGVDGERFSYGLGQFLQEARTLCKFSHPNVVRVREFFEQNNTAYLAMDYYEGISLEEYRRRNGGKLNETTALALMTPIMDGLLEVHAKGFLHRDVKPSNIYLTNTGIPILLDFGAARLALHGHGARTLSVILTPGFAPFEQYLEKAEFGPTTDIYAIGATLYYLLTGEKPQEAAGRYRRDEMVPPHELTPTITLRTSFAVMRTLAIEPEQRPQTIQELKALLLPDGPMTSIPVPVPSRPAPGRLNLACSNCGTANSIPGDISPTLLRCVSCGENLGPSAEKRRVLKWWWGGLLGSVLVLVWGLARFGPTDQSRITDIPSDRLTDGGPTERGPGIHPEFDRPADPPYPPPQTAIDACQGKAVGMACQLQPPGRAAEPGTCYQIHAYFACVPNGFPAPFSGPPGQHP
ncbi:serine/threonine protein kinase [Methylomagnum sp.]